VAGFERNNILNLRAGEEDGMINFDYQIHNGGATEVTVLVPGMKSSDTFRNAQNNTLFHRSWGVSRVSHVHDLHQFGECASNRSFSP
jgi:hypothetical protein